MKVRLVVLEGLTEFELHDLTKVSDDEAEIEIAQGVKVRVVKGTLSQVLTASTKPAND